MEKAMSWRESLRLTFRGWQIWWKLRPTLLVSMALSAAVQAVTPYTSIYFSARIIGELSQGRDPQVLAWWVGLLLGVTAGLLLLGGALSRWVIWEKEQAYVWDDKLNMDKMMDLDYALMQEKEIYDLYEQIRQNFTWGCWGMCNLLKYFSDGLTYIFRVIVGIVLSAGLVALRIPQNHALVFLNHPLCMVIVVAVMLAVAFLSPVCANRSNAYWGMNGEEMRLGNRIFSRFGFDCNDSKRALDMRIYEQQPNVCQIYLRKHATFTTDSRMAQWGRGPMGLWAAAGKGISALLTGVVYLYVCLKAWAGAFGVDGITQYVGAVTTLFAGVAGLMETLGELQCNARYLAVSLEFLDVENQMYQGSLTTEKRSDRNYQVEFRDVSFRYPDSEAWALRHVNLKFQVGSRLAVVGENGSGKSTFIKLLCRLYDPTEGEILLNGIDIRKYQYPDYIALFSVVFQDFHLLALPLGQNVAGSTQYDRERVAQCLTQAGIMDRVEKMDQGLDTYLYKDLEKKGVEVSGGEAQKIAIARALYKDAPFIILDEPTAALDPIAEAEVYSKFDQIAGDKTAVYISHRLSSCKFCDDIVVFDHGHIVQQGSHQHLVEAEGMYAQLWQAQAQYYQKQEQ